MTDPRAPAGRGARLLLEASRHALAHRCADGLMACGDAARGRLALLVSGGSDSMAMLVLVAAIRARIDPDLESLAVLSVDHGLRPEAAAECAHAVSLARELGIGVAAAVKVEVAHSGNLLDRARAARLAAARDFVEAHACAAAAVAHTADDRAESLLLGLRRGGGLAAAARLRPVRTFADGSAPTLVRPLLKIRREELRAFLREIGVEWRDDPSNQLHDRGALRTDPALAALVDSIADGASRLAEEAIAAIEARDKEIGQILGEVRDAMPRERLDLLPQSVQAAALQSLVRAQGGEAPHTVIDQAVAALQRADRSPLRFSCANGVELVVDAREARACSLR